MTSPFFTFSVSLTKEPAFSSPPASLPLTLIVAFWHHVGMRSVSGIDAPSCPPTLNVSTSSKGYSVVQVMVRLPCAVVKVASLGP